jgi:hypothetical protein
MACLLSARGGGGQREMKKRKNFKAVKTNRSNLFMTQLVVVAVTAVEKSAKGGECVCV